MNILTYNVCWGCMAANETSSKNVTAYNLAKKCKDLSNKSSGSHPCLDNVTNILINGNYDIIGLQEVVNFNIIYDKLKGKKNIYNYVHSKVINKQNIHINIVTIYDKNKYKILYIKSGNIETIDKNIGRTDRKELVEDGRPYQILFLNRIIDSKKFIFINLHNGHNISKDILIKNLSYNLNNVFNVIGTSQNINNADMYSEKYKYIDIITTRDFLDKNNIHVIVAGDFNDHGRFNYWDELKIFNNSKIPELSEISVSSQSFEPPPKSCCQTKRVNTMDPFYGDYILISENLKYITNNKIPTDFNPNHNKCPTSDHMPIMAKIDFVNKFLAKGDDIEIKYLLSNNYNFSHVLDQNLNTNTILIYPDSSIYSINNNDYIYIQCLNDTNKIGYININSIKHIGNNQFKLKNKYSKSEVTLRLFIDSKDNNKLNKSSSGRKINKNDTFIFPNGEIIDDHVILQKEDNPNIIGYINMDNLEIYRNKL